MRLEIQTDWLAQHIHADVEDSIIIDVIILAIDATSLCKWGTSFDICNFFRFFMYKWYTYSHEHKAQSMLLDALESSKY